MKVFLDNAKAVAAGTTADGSLPVLRAGRRALDVCPVGFANIGSIGIQIGGTGPLTNGRSSDLARLGVRALVAGALTNFVNACIAGLLL